MLNFPSYSSFTDIQKRLDALGLFHMDLDLKRMEAFIRQWNKKLPALHIVGTNGKGSTANYFDALARAHGLCSGLYTSPHFLSPRERTRIDGQMLSENTWLELANTLAELETEHALEFTYFEWLTALAALAFDQSKVDVAIMEAGLGGCYDAVKVFEPRLLLLTPVGLDHEQYLGSSLEEIARDKSQAITQSCVAISAEQKPEVMSIYIQRAKNIGAQLVFSKTDVNFESCAYQKQNATLALCAWEKWCELHELKYDSKQCFRILARTRFQGRFQLTPPQNGTKYLLDGAHNAHGLQALKEALAQSTLSPEVIIFTCMRDKNIKQMCELILSFELPIIVPELDIPERNIPANVLANTLGRQCYIAQDMDSALKIARSKGSLVLICGSLYLLASFYSFYPHLLEGA